MTYSKNTPTAGDLNGKIANATGQLGTASYYTQDTFNAQTLAASLLAGDPVAKTVTKDVIREVAQNAALAYDAKIIEKVPAGYDVIIDPNGAVTVTGQDADGNTIIEWDIGTMYQADGTRTASYYLLPNNKLGEDYVFGTVLTSTSAVMYCKPVTEGGDEIAIVMDNPVVTIAADANEDIPNNGQSYLYGTDPVAFNLLDNDSAAKKLQAMGTTVTDTYVSNISLVNVTLNGAPLNTAISSNGKGWEVAVSDSAAGLTYGTIYINENGDVTFAETAGTDLLTTQQIDVNFHYDLSFHAWQDADEAKQAAGSNIITTGATVRFAMAGATVPVGPGPGPGPGPVIPVGPVDPVEEIIPDDTPAAGPDQQTDQDAGPRLTPIDDEATPLAGPQTPGWALLNLLLTVATSLTSVLMLASLVGKKKETDAAKAAVGRFKKQGAVRLMTLVPCAGAVVAFLLTENMSQPMIFTDQWTPLMAAITAVQLGLTALGVKRVKTLAPDEAGIDE